MKMHTLFSKLTWVILATFLTTVSFNSIAEELTAPQKLVKDASDMMLASLEDNKAELESDPDKIYKLVENQLTPYFDFEKMTKLALGKNWRGLDKKQQAQFVEEFRLLLIRTYSTAMLEYSDQQINMLPFRDDLSRKRVNVPMEIIQPSGPSIPMALSLYENDSNEWKVYDVRIDGISLVTNYRSSFATEIRNKGADQLIADLAQRNAKLK